MTDVTEVGRVISELKKIRKQKKLSQKEVAEGMGAVQSFVVLIEKTAGKRDIQTSTLFRYARAIGVRLKIVMEPVDEEKDAGR